MKRLIFLFFGLALVLLIVNGMIVKKEGLIKSGTTMYLELAPVDPRSLMQGDYMSLDYKIAREASKQGQNQKDGRLVVQLNSSNGTVQFVRFHKTGDTLNNGEHFLVYKRREGRLQVGSPSFFFQEGHADCYEDAKFGELKVDDNGMSVLIGLRDEHLKRLQSNENCAKTEGAFSW